MLISWSNHPAASLRPLYVVPDRRVPRTHHVPAGRTLHLVDLENLMGGPFQSLSSMRCVSNWYRRTAPVQREDHVIVAVNPMLAMPAASEWPGTLLRVARGRDGADLALINELRDATWIASHFDRVVIGSGDGIFAPAIDAIRNHGIAVGILARERRIARSLRGSANFLVLLTRDDAAQDVA